MPEKAAREQPEKAKAKPRKARICSRGPRYQYNKAMYQTFIGLEVHIHLLTKTKVFCGCRSAAGDEPNTNICPVCMGYPGVMPQLNVEALRMGCAVARALNCAIPDATWFERKQYFYPDMTKNYQISQFASPLGRNGTFTIEGRGIKKNIRIHECHLEEDAGKMIHSGNVSLLDYNRAGVSLLEIVTEPDMESGEEAELFIQQLRRTVRYLDVCDGNMEEGSLRADANISINTPGAGLGRKVEIKNLNSSRFVRLGLNYEAARQAALLDAGRHVVQETRLWNENRDQTEPMRTKENAHDYRYFPEPDIPAFYPDAAFLQSVEAAQVELPLARQKRVTRDYGLSEEAAGSICEEKALACYYEEAAAEAARLGMKSADAALKIANWLLTEVRHLLSRENKAPKDIFTLKIPPAGLAELVVLLERGVVSQKNAKQTLEKAALEGKTPAAIIREEGWERVSDPAVIDQWVRAVFEQEAGSVREIQTAKAEGNEKRRKAIMTSLTGKVIALARGKADPLVAAARIGALLEAAGLP